MHGALRRRPAISDTNQIYDDILHMGKLCTDFVICEVLVLSETRISLFIRLMSEKVVRYPRDLDTSHG